MEHFTFPADVPINMRSEFYTNYNRLTFNTGRLLLFAADHKIEHMDSDFHGPQVVPEAHNPRHLFTIAREAPIGGFATQLGLVARYGLEYPTIHYVIKLNSKTNLAVEKDAFSRQLWTVQDVVAFKRTSHLLICAVGVTVYLGSEFEDIMLQQAAQMVFQAHNNGLVALLWMYPRGHSITKENDPLLLAGSVGVAAALGADFVKIHPPEPAHSESLRFIIQAAGNTKVICAGGSQKKPEELIKDIRSQLTSGSSGAAIGRNIYQHSVSDALHLSQALSEIIYQR